MAVALLREEEAQALTFPPFPLLSVPIALTLHASIWTGEIEGLSSVSIFSSSSSSLIVALTSSSSGAVSYIVSSSGMIVIVMMMMKNLYKSNNF